MDKNKNLCPKGLCEENVAKLDIAKLMKVTIAVASHLAFVLRLIFAVLIAAKGVGLAIPCFRFHHAQSPASGGE